MAEHILHTFDEALDRLRNDLLMMASLTERNLLNAFEGLFRRDTELCNRVIADDEEVDQLEKQVDQDGMEVMLRFQPVARDLRHVIAVMKLSGNLERISDQAVSIARKARKLNQQPALAETMLLEQMRYTVVQMMRDSIRAYTEKDLQLAYTLKPRDRELDKVNAEVGEQLTEVMSQQPDRVADYLNLIFITRHMERVGDHTTNIAEDVVFAVAAEDIRHVKEPTR